MQNSGAVRAARMRRCGQELGISPFALVAAVCRRTPAPRLQAGKCPRCLRPPGQLGAPSAIVAFPIIAETLYGAARFHAALTGLSYQYQRLGGKPAAFGGRFDAVYFDPGGGPGLRLLRRDADRACPRRRPLRARNLAAAFARDHRRIFRPALLGSRGRGDPPVRRRRDLRRRSRPHGERGLCHLPPSRGGPARPGRAPINSCWSCFTARPWRSRTWRCS